MSQVLALITQDSALLRCELDRVREGLPAVPGDLLGVGAWQDGQVVQRRYGSGAPSEEAWEPPDSEVVLMATSVNSPGQGPESVAQPFRFRQWLFAATGHVERAPAVRERLWEELPEFLQGTVRGPSWEEAAFARFLAELRDLGRIEDPQLDAKAAAVCLGRAASAVDLVSGAVGALTRPAVGLVASNGRLLIAACRGAQLLSYRLLEGRAGCSRHQLADDAPEGEVLVRDHRRRRSIAVAAISAEGWLRLADGATLAVDRRLALTIEGGR